MKFKLRTLFGLMTLCAIGIAIVQYRAEQARLLEAHRVSFSQIDDCLSGLDEGIKAEVMAIPEIMGQLKASSPLSPQIALGQSIVGESMSVGKRHFNRKFHFHWQLPDGSRTSGVLLTVTSVINEEDLGEHSVQIFYEPTQWNTQIAAWVDDQLKKTPHIQTEHVTDGAQPKTGFIASNQPINPLY